VDALITNTHFLPSACLAVRLEGLHFGLGATVAVRRTALERAGGLDALLTTPADDYVLGQNVEAAGWRLAWVPMVVDHAVADSSWRTILRRHLRWARVVRHVRLRGYFGQVLTHGSVPTLLLAALMALAPHRREWLLVPAGWWAFHAAALWHRRKLLGLRTWDLPLLPLADVLAFLVFVGGMLGRAESRAERFDVTRNVHAVILPASSGARRDPVRRLSRGAAELAVSVGVGLIAVGAVLVSIPIER
jgi:ceramide glucosyltransferase